MDFFIGVSGIIGCPELRRLTGRGCFVRHSSLPCPMLTTALALFAAAAVVQAAVPADLVASLPGFGAPPTTWYSGYLPVDGQYGGKLMMHYIFISSPNPTSDPISLWLNGGPGCSSLEGLFQEMGQLWVDESDPTKLVLNTNAWTNISSMLFLEAPA